MAMSSPETCEIGPFHNKIKIQWTASILSCRS